jgi:putative membrane protein
LALASDGETGSALKQGATALKQSAEGLNDSADRRTELAADRTVLAAERTYASWVQLGLGALASGVAAKKTLAGTVPEWMIVATGTLLVLFSAFCFGAAIWRQLNTGAPPPRPDVRRIPPAMLILVNGSLVIVDIAALIGIWFGRSGG